MKEEKVLLEQKFYQITQHYEESRLQIDELTRQNISLQNQKQNQYPIPIQQTIDHRYELDDVWKMFFFTQACPPPGMSHVPAPSRLTCSGVFKSDL